ncbi:MAG TPA: transmembrane prediction [Verrucomicrobiales bacterium]|nr:transmembrane prediction [Verrucomicrobiales bacterium]
MRYWKWLLPCLVLLVMRSSLSQVAPEIRRGVYKGREVQFPHDARQFRGWRHYGRNLPVWKVSEELPKDVFTFARLCYPFRRGLRWTADYPEAELNFSWRLHQLTSVQVNPFPVIIDIDAGQLRHHPFLYVSEPSNMDISDEQARVLREYMLNGGFILMDDFWGGEEWQAFVATFKQIWPDRGFTELKPDHPLFHCVFDLPAPPQVHSNVYWSHKHKGTRNTTSNEIRPDAAQPVFRAVHDDRGRMVMLICLNNDMGDGWEQESFDTDYFREVSEKHAYPLGINIVFYVLTH